MRKHKEIFHGAKVAVYGSTSPRIETLVLALNASKVITIEYNNLTYEHERIETITKPEFDRLRESPDEKHHIEHDIALSISRYCNRMIIVATAPIQTTYSYLQF